MTTDDVTRSARQLSQIANVAFAQNSEIQQIAERINKQLLIKPVVSVKLQEEMARAASQLLEPMQEAAAVALQGFQAPLYAESAKVVAAFQANMNKLVLDFPTIIDSVAKNLAAVRDVRPMMEQLEAIRIPTQKLAPEFLASLRLEANKAVEQTEGPERGALWQTLRSLEGIDDAANTAKTDSRQNLVLLVMILGVVFDFLADQREILETAFENMALLAAALTHVWQYAVALVVLLLSYDAIRRE